MLKKLITLQVARNMGN